MNRPFRFNIEADAHILKRRPARKSTLVRELARLLNEMLQTGHIRNYALFGATAQMGHTEPVATLDAAVLVAVFSDDRLDRSAPTSARRSP